MVQGKAHHLSYPGHTQSPLSIESVTPIDSTFHTRRFFRFGPMTHPRDLQLQQARAGIGRRELRLVPGSGAWQQAQDTRVGRRLHPESGL